MGMAVCGETRNEVCNEAKPDLGFIYRQSDCQRLKLKVPIFGIASFRPYTLNQPQSGDTVGTKFDLIGDPKSHAPKPRWCRMLSSFLGKYSPY